MPWTRYDDSFHHNHKVLAAKALDPGCLALHLLANTWTSTTKTPGFVAHYVPGELVGRLRGKKWATILTSVGLWTPGDVDGVEGWFFHDYATYNPSRDELAQRRSEAGKKGAAARWKAKQGDGKSHGKANGKRVAKNAPYPELPTVVLPEPVASNDASTPVGDAGASAGDLVKAYVDGATKAGKPRPSERLRAKVGRDGKRLLEEGVAVDALLAAASRLGATGWDDLDRELQRMRPPGVPVVIEPRTEPKAEWR